MLGNSPEDAACHATDDAEQYQPYRPYHPISVRHHGPGPCASEFQTRHGQWPNAVPWPQQDQHDAFHPTHVRPFRLQNAPTGSMRLHSSRSPRPLLELRVSDEHVPPDLSSSRSDSFFYSSKTTTSRPCPSPTPTIPHFPSSPRTRAESTPAPRAPRSEFPGLSSNPVIFDMPKTRRFPVLGRQQEHSARPSPVSNVESPVESRQATPTEGNMGMENFSRPRKPSVRLQQSDSALSRRMAAPRLHADMSLEQPTAHLHGPPKLSSNPSPWPRPRRLSGSSSQSSSTFSSIPHLPSHDHFSNASRNDSLRHANPSVPSAPAAYARPAPAHSKNNGAQAHARELSPLLTAGDELRSSFRSQLTASTALGTLSTVTGTERNSILTKASSITEQSIINGYVRTSWRPSSVDDGLSLEDVMCMYERGFNDSDIESVRKSMRFADDDDDDDVPRVDIDAGIPDTKGSRPASSHSDASGLREKMLEAMSDSLPIPGAVSIPEPGRRAARESVARTRRSLLPSSLPKEIGLGLAAEHMAKRTNTEPEGMDKHDSAKMLDGDDELATLPAEMTAPPSPTSPAQEQPPATDLLASATAIAPTASRIPQEPPEEPGSRDRYGFRKASVNVTRQEYDAWNATYTEYLARRRKKWIAFLKDHSLMTDRPIRFPPRSAKTKRFIRKGIPPDWRGAAWFYYAGGPAILSKHRGVYDQLVSRAGLDRDGPGRIPSQTGEVKPLIVEDIEKDLYRTFPDNVRFKPPPPPPTETEALESAPPPEPDIITSLRRVLHAFALYNPRIGYCQSLNFLAGLLLLFVGTEEQAFWLLNVITRVYLPGTHEMSLEGSKVDLGVLMLALKDSMPGVWKQIGGDEFEGSNKKGRGRKGKDGHKAGQGSISDPNRLPAITLCMTAWFMSCFIGTLPIETVLRVWDVFFYEGSRTLFRIALTIFKLGEREIKAVQDPMEMFGVVQTFPRRMIDCNTLMEACYKRRNGIGHLSQESVEERRQERREGIRRWKAEQEAAASETNSPMPGTRHRLGAAIGIDLAADFDDVRRKGTVLFGRRRDREQARAAEVV